MKVVPKPAGGTAAVGCEHHGTVEAHPPGCVGKAPEAHGIDVGGGIDDGTAALHRVKRGGAAAMVGAGLEDYWPRDRMTPGRERPGRNEDGHG